MDPAPGELVLRQPLETAATAGAAVSSGRRSTFYGWGGMRLLEAHVLGVEGSRYGQEVVAYLARGLG